MVHPLLPGVFVINTYIAAIATCLEKRSTGHVVIVGVVGVLANVLVLPLTFQRGALWSITLVSTVVCWIFFVLQLVGRVSSHIDQRARGDNVVWWAGRYGILEKDVLHVLEKNFDVFPEDECELILQEFQTKPRPEGDTVAQYVQRKRRFMLDALNELLINRLP
jgi:hypothetical protein